MQENLPVIYQDEHLIAIHKPAGLLVHRSDVDRHETRFAVQMLRDQIGVPVSPVHRLDKATSGLLLFAVHAEAAQKLTALLMEQRVDKTYLAVVRGWPAEQGVIDHPLTRIKDPYDKPREKYEPQDALTRYRTLNVAAVPIPIDKFPEARYALVEAEPKTGRRHQIRRHLKHIAHPIIGDVRYGKGVHNRFFREHFGIERLLLACTSMRFVHPYFGTELKLRAPVADDFVHATRVLGWSGDFY